jgi:hypothetical protein
MKLSKSKVFFLVLFGFTIFLLGGGFDVIKSFAGGEADASLMSNPKVTGLSPVVMVLYAFGFFGVMFIFWSGRNMKTNEKLAIKQFYVGLVMVFVVYALVTLVLRVGMD